MVSKTLPVLFSVLVLSGCAGGPYARLETQPSADSGTPRVLAARPVDGDSAIAAPPAPNEQAAASVELSLSTVPAPDAVTYSVLLPEPRVGLHAQRVSRPALPAAVQTSDGAVGEPAVRLRRPADAEGRDGLPTRLPGELPEPRLPAALEPAAAQTAAPPAIDLTPTQRHPSAPPTVSRPVAPDPDTGPDRPAVRTPEPTPQTQPAAAPIPAAPPALSTTAAGPRTPSPKPDQQLDAVAGTEFGVHLQGAGWIFTGADQDGVEYRRRRSGDSHTEVILRISEAGSYRLHFQRQNLGEGSVERSLIGVNVAAERSTARVTAATQATGSQAGPVAELPVDPQQRDPTAGDDPAVADDPEDTVALWRRDRSLEQPLDSDARRGLFEGALQNQHYEQAVEYAQQMLDHGEAPAVAAVARLAERTTVTEGAEDVIELLQRRLALADKHTHSAGRRESDALLFQLARLYETTGAHRNLRASLSYYRRITEEYPLSRYWEPARARIEYLERHFFHVR